MRPFLCLFLTLLNVNLIAQPAPSIPRQRTDAHMPVAGMSLSIVPPPGFAVATEFTGYVQRASRATLLISELGGTVQANLSKFSRESLLSRGMFVQKEETFMNGLVPARFVEAEQFAHGTKHIKYIYLFGDAEHCFLITASFPKDVSDLGPLIRPAMLSALPVAGE